MSRPGLFHLAGSLIGTAAALLLTGSATAITDLRSTDSSAATRVDSPSGRTQQCDRERTVVIAHRGTGTGTRTIDAQSYSENTLPAFKMAMSLGADGFETDYWPTRDRRIVSHHDADLARTTDGSGPIARLTWKYLRTVSTPSGAGLPTLHAVERTMAPYAGLRQQEIKQGAAFSDELLERLIRIDRVYVDASDVLITASEWRTLARVHDLDAAVGTGYITRSHTGRPDPEELPEWLDVILIDLDAADEQYVKHVQEAGHMVSVRGVDTVAQLHRAVALGADRVITDRPETIAQAC